MSGRVIEQTHVTSAASDKTYCVSTVQLSVEHDGGMWYETYVFPSDGENISDWGEVWGTRYRTEAEATANHPLVVRDLTSGTLLDYSEEPL